MSVYRIARQIEGKMVYISYLGPYDGIPKGWSFVMRRIAS